MSAALETYDEQVLRLDQDYVERTGAAVRAELGSGEAPVAVSYQPDNGTAYALVFTPLPAIKQLGPWNVPSGCGEGFGWTLVTQANGGPHDWAYPFNLTPGRGFLSVGYVAEHTRSNIADASAITALFRAICGAPLLDGDA